MKHELTFDSIAQAGRAIVDAHKKKRGFEEGIRRLLADLYPDNAHFIYELLQNAEDAYATIVEFELGEDALDVRHNGLRMFSLSDIDSITNIGDSTKKDDPTQIGKFGVGFKAVYSYTSRPEICSGEYSFAIKELFVNERIDRWAPEGWTTFRFPFDREEKPAELACAEVARGLTELDESTLLFLNHIGTVTYALPDGTVGIVERQDAGNKIIKIQKSEGSDFVDSYWLRLVGGTSIEHDGINPLSVAAGFRIELGEPAKARDGRARAGDGAEEAPSRSIVPLDRGDVSIYFPAVKESSGLRFHIHAPFASTVARDSVRDEPGNIQLVKDVGALIVDALPGLCRQGLIDDSFLAALPNHHDVLGHPYSLIRDAITEAFNDLEITPARGAGYAAARSLVASPGEFRNWLTESDLTVLLALADLDVDGAPRWIRERDGRAGRFLNGLDTIDFGWDELGTALMAVAERSSYAYVNGAIQFVKTPTAENLEQWVSWLASKTDGSIVRFYQLLGRGWSTRSLDDSIDLKSIPIVRLRPRGGLKHVKGPETFLPSRRTDSAQTRVPVDLAYFEDDDDHIRGEDLRAFYNAAGVRRWNESARIAVRLQTYEPLNRPIPEGDDLTKHIRDVKAFSQYALANRDGAQDLFSGVPFLLSPNPDGDLEWIAPKFAYLDTPFAKTGLGSLYRREKLEWGDEADEYEWEEADRYPVAGIYLDLEGVNEFLELAGAQTRIEITRVSVFRNLQLKRGWWVNNRHSDYTIMVDWGIEELDRVVDTGDLDLLRTLWQSVVDAKADKARAVYRANKSAQRHEFESQLAQKLKSTAWVLDRHGDVRLPREVSLGELPEDWPPPTPSSLVHELDFGSDATQRSESEERVNDFLREEGLDVDGIDILREVKEAGIEGEELREWIRERRAVRGFPASASEDPARRAAVAELDAADAPEYTTASRLRTVPEAQAQDNAKSKIYLRGQYTTDTGEMFCQACRKPLPFKVNGQWYFEAVRFVSARKQVHAVNAIALCPLCAALYKHKRETKNEDLLEEIATTSVAEGQAMVEIPVLLNGKRVEIGFTGKHAIDIQATLDVAGEERGSDR